MKIGIIIGRFQFSEISKGLRDLISSVEKENDQLAIVLGESKARGSKVNPFNASIRERMFKDAFPSTKVFVLDDHPSDEQWSHDLDEIIEANFPKQSITLYGSSDSFVPFYHGKYPVKASGQSVNEDVNVDQLEDTLKTSTEFRKGIQYALNNSFDKVFPTVDIALFRNDKTEILLGFKDLDKKWRLIGGFADPRDSGYDQAVLRELKEEAGVEDVKNLSFERSFKVDDWRYKREPDKIITSFFSAELISGEAAGSDDIAKVKWFSLSEVKGLLDKKEVVPEHLPLFEYLLKKYLK